MKDVLKRSGQLVGALSVSLFLAGCGAPKCGSEETKSVFDLAFRNLLQTELSQGLLSPMEPTYDSLPKEQKDMVQAQIDPAFPITLSEIVEVSKSDKSVSCTAKINTKNGRSLMAEYTSSKTEDGMLQVRITNVQ